MESSGNPINKKAMVVAGLASIMAAVGVGIYVRRRNREMRCTSCNEIGARAFCDDKHDGKVARISKQLGTRTETEPVSLRKKAVSHQVPKQRDLRVHDDKIDISDLDEILEIDPYNRTCTAEPGVTFVDLVDATLRYGLVPIVVPELKTITVGGAVAGCSIESMSYKYGGFHDSCLEYEVITADGEVLVCTPGNENRLVFQMIHGSFGTLGILSRLKFRLIPAKPYVRLIHEKYGSVSDYMSGIWKHYKDRDHDFMDGIIHSPDNLVLCMGDFVDHAPYANRYDWMKIYYRSTDSRSEDYLRTPDYFFRYDRGVTNVQCEHPIPNLFLGKFMGSSSVLNLADKFRNLLLDDDNPVVTLDVFIPFSKMDGFLDWYEKEFGYFPLWCVPYKRVRDYEWIADGLMNRMNRDELFVDLAIYGMKQDGTRNYHKVMEDKLREIGGIKTLISHNYYTEDEFWQSWNKPNYYAVKNRTDPDNIFRDLYHKTCKAAMGIRDDR
jgi:FAD/FMN-containing dehydrogenase